MKKIIFIFLYCGLSAVTHAAALRDTLARPEFQEALDQASRSTRTFDEVRLLHMGDSWPARMRELESSRRYFLQTVPFWLNDAAGDAVLTRYRQKLQANPRFDFRLIFDWASPLLSRDPLKLMQFGRLESLFGSRIRYWNDPSWKSPWSRNDGPLNLGALLRYRIHEKVLVFDGQTAIIGGMNIGEGHLRGGTESGWRDDDLLLRGPIVRVALAHQLRILDLIEYFSAGHELPLSAGAAGSFLEQWLWAGDSAAAAGGDEALARIDGQNSARFPPATGTPSNSHLVPTRLIYSNPLPADLQGNARESSALLKTLRLLLGQAQHRVRLYLPYPSLGDQMRDLIVATARRGVDVRIITNSEASNDVEHSYFAGLGHYLALLDAGVRIYEWRGHDELRRFAAEGCPIRAWPGRTLHSKIVLIDDDVVLLGSHNLNARSEHYNSEMTVMVEDPVLNRTLQDIFDQDIRVDWGKTWNCPAGALRPLSVTHQINRFRAEILVRENQEKIDTARSMLEYL